jgi:2-oxo-4-hydroxy-4-carboxy-5-ureidoimidazoline decarboxylase
MTMDMSMPTVKELLSKPTSEITSFLGGIYEHSVWVAEELVQNKADAYASFETVTDLAALMKSIVDDASKEKKMVLLCAHPDLCEKVGKFESLTEESIEEQSRSGLQSLTEEETERFTTMRRNS